MLKKIVVTSGIALLAVGFVFGRDAVSYLATGVGCVKDSVRDSVPVRFQIERAKKMIGKIEPEVYKNKSMIVREEVAVERLAKRIANLETKQEKERTNILRMKDDLDTGEKYIYYAGNKYTDDQVRIDLENRFARFKTRDEELSHLRAQLSQQEKVLGAARQKLDSMLSKRSQLIAEVAKLEAQEKMLSVTKSASDIEIDDSTLARVNELVAQIESRLEVETRMLDSAETFVVEIQVEEKHSEDISRQIAQYFSDAHDVGALAAVSDPAEIAVTQE